MPSRNIVTIGGSAGSIPCLTNVVSSLPKNLPAAIFVVVHIRLREQSFLPAILARNSQLPVAHATHGQKIELGRIYVAPPDRHMLIAEGHLHLSRGPKEGLHRPSINATFRTAANTYKSRVIGVLLSGMLDDGASGLWDIVRLKGIAIVQDPDEAEFPSMPLNALQDVPVSYKLKSEDIGPRLVQLTTSDEALAMPDEERSNHLPNQVFSGFTCPECHGPLFTLSDGPPEFECRVGHRFPLQTLVEEASSTRERRMYEAIVSLEEGADIAEYAAKHATSGKKAKFLNEARQLRRHATTIKQLVEEPQEAVKER
jgi:two-component system chemotaxis response regulator CheB